MATTAMTVRLDSNVKKQFDALCQQFGMSSNTALNIFVNQVVRSRSIPFTITVAQPKAEPDKKSEEVAKEEARQRALEAFRRQRERAERGKTPDLSLDEINAEIREARKQMQEA